MVFKSRRMGWLSPITAAAVLLTSSVSALGDSAPARQAESQQSLKKQTAKLLAGPIATPARRVSLGPLSDAEKGAFTAEASQAKYHQVGVGRTLGKSQRQFPLASLAWTTAGDGTRYTTIEFQSSYAAATRLGLLTNKWPRGVTLQAYGTYSPDQVYGPYSGNELQIAGGRTKELYWLPVIEGDTIRIELQADKTADLSSAMLEVPALSHLVQSIGGGADKLLSDIGRAGTCNIDIACTPPSSTEWVNRGKAVAKYYLTTPQGSTGICTGTLINANTTQVQNFFLTANHCINTVGSANSMHFYWFFERAVCNGPNPTTVTETTGGATFMYTVETNDMTLVRLNAAPPAGSVLAAWTNTSLTAGANIFDLHHPAGDLKKFSQGTHQAFDSYLGNAANTPNAHIRVVWNQGTTEQGSSGSALWNANGQVVGTLHGGRASCATPTSPDWFGRFDQAYASLQPWLSPANGIPAAPQPPNLPTPVALATGSPTAGSVALDQDKWYSIQTTGSTTSLTVTLTNLTADADLYIFKNAQTGTPQCVSNAGNTTSETCTINAPGAATWYIDVYGYETANFTVTATSASAPPANGGGGSSDSGGGAMGYAWIAILLCLAFVRRFGLHAGRGMKQ